MRANNKYAVKLLGLIIKEMREKKNRGPTDKTTPGKTKAKSKKDTTTPAKSINRVGEREHFDRVLINQVKELAELGGYAPETATDRRLEIFWKVMKGFNGHSVDASPHGNQELDKILVTFIQIRTGHIPHLFDELEAAIKAVQVYYLDNTKDNNEVGQGQWTLPIVHLLYFHMKHVGVTPIAFHPDCDQDETHAKPQRESHTSKIWVTVGDDTMVECKVENRENVLQEFNDFLTDHMGLPECDVMEDEGPPSTVHTPEPPAKKPRRSLNLTK